MRLYVANHNPVPRAHVTFVTFRRTRVTWGPGARLHQPMKRNLEFPREFRHKKGYRNGSREGHFVYFSWTYYIGKCKVCFGRSIGLNES